MVSELKIDEVKMVWFIWVNFTVQTFISAVNTDLKYPFQKMYWVQI